MRRNHCHVPSFLALLSLVLLPSSAAFAAEVSLYQGYGASANFYRLDECVETIVSVSVSDTWYRKPSASEPRLVTFVEIRTTNLCGYDDELYIFESIYPVEGTLEMDGKLESARLNLHAPVYDYRHQETLYVDIALAWEGTGGMSRRSTRDNSRTDELHRRYAYTEVRRPAQAVGSVQVNGAEMMPDLSFNATLSSLSLHQTVVEP